MCAFAITTTGCAGDGDASEGATRTVSGDTTVIRWAGDGEWGAIDATEELRIGQLDGADEYTFGEITGLDVSSDGSLFVVDAHARQVRVYDPAGSHVRSFGGDGSGPGELRSPNGLRVLDDGSIAVRDFGNRRYNIYSQTGESLSVINIPGGYSTTSPFFVDTDGLLYNPMNVAPPGEDWQNGLERFRPDGTVVDTIEPPSWGYEPPTLVAEREGARAIYGVPNTPREVWTFSPHGYVVGGVSSAYAIEYLLPDSTVLRAERVVEPTTLTAGEKAQLEARATRGLRFTDPSWRWNGPPIPDVKPYYHSLFADDDGRIWVRVTGPATAEPIDAEDLADAAPDAPRERWVEPNNHDIFTSDGTLLGTVELPQQFTLYVARGNNVWGVIRDEYDVQYVVRLRISPAAQER